MPEGRLGVKRPLVKTTLKYNIDIRVDEMIWDNPPKAIDLLDMRVNAPQQDSNSFIKDKIGKIILAVNNLYNPNYTKIIYEEEKTHVDDVNVPEGIKEVNLTYVVRGSGMGTFAETSSNSYAIHDLHKVLIEEDDTPIEGAIAQREWNPDPYKVNNIRISTD